MLESTVKQGTKSLDPLLESFDVYLILWSPGCRDMSLPESLSSVV